MNQFVDWSAIGTYLLPIISSVITWLVGTRKRKNDFLRDLQSSIDLLTQKNTELLKKVVLLGEENAQLLANQSKLNLRIKTLEGQNEALRKEVETLNATLAGVRTITRTAQK